MNKIMYHKILANNLFAFENSSFIVRNKQGALTLCLYSTQDWNPNWARKSKVIHIEFQKQHYPCWDGNIVYVENSKAYPNC